MPSPPKQNLTVWKRIPRLSQTIPFGYELDPEDERILNPVITELELLEDAKRLVKEYSLREVANWLSEKTGRYISHQGLSQRIKNDRSNQKIAEGASKYAEWAQEVAELAQALEERVGIDAEVERAREEEYTRRAESGTLRPFKSARSNLSTESGSTD